MQARPESDGLAPLGLLLGGLSEQRVSVERLDPGKAAGDRPPRPVLTPNHLLLPRQDSVEAAAAVAHACAHLRFSPQGLPSKGLKPMTVAIVSSLEDERVERLFGKQFPGARAWFDEALRGPRPPGELSFAGLLARLSRVLADPTCPDDNHWVDKGRSLFEAAARDLHDYDAFRRLASVLANDLGQMRVRFDPSAYGPWPSYRDDNSYLWQHATTEDNPERSIGVGAARKTSHPATPHEDASTSARIELTRTVYPEWDARLETYRTDWCTVIDKPAEFCEAADGIPDPSASERLQRIVLQRGGMLARRRPLWRQPEGDDIDLNAAVTAMVERRQGAQLDPRTFKRPGRRERSSSILLLLDLSESTNDRRASGDTVLSVEIAAALSMTGAIRAAGDRVAVHGFSSDTRDAVSYWRLLEGGNELDTDTARRLLSVRAQHSTRLGAALRHAASQFAEDTADHHGIVVITDGTPSDVDVHDDRYLVEDARRAVRESHDRGVLVFGLVIAGNEEAAPRISEDARRLFGRDGFASVHNVRDLTLQLRRVYRRLTMR